MVHRLHLLLYIATSEETEWGPPFNLPCGTGISPVFVIPAPTAVVGLLEYKMSLENGQGVLA